MYDYISIRHRKDSDFFARVTAIRNANGGSWDSSRGALQIPKAKSEAFLADVDVASKKAEIEVGVQVNGTERQLGHREPRSHVVVGYVDSQFASRVADLRKAEFPNAEWNTVRNQAFVIPQRDADRFAVRVGELGEAYGKQPDVKVISGFDAVKIDINGVDKSFVAALTSARHEVKGAYFDRTSGSHMIPCQDTESFIGQVHTLSDDHARPISVTVNGALRERAAATPEVVAMPLVAEVSEPPPKSVGEAPKAKPTTYPEPRTSYPWLSASEPQTRSSLPRHEIEKGEGFENGGFGTTARAMVANGWSVYPQEYSGKRQPSKGRFGATIELEPLQSRLPTPVEITDWTSFCANKNAACVLGHGSGNTFVLDIDVENEIMSEDIQELADKMLGETPLRRVGSAPKIALFYRNASEDADHFRSRDHKFGAVNERGENCGYALEVLGAGKSITMMGLHHKTGDTFKWLRPGQNPLFVGPEAAPLVKPEQLQAFIAAVAEKYPFLEKQRSKATISVSQPSDGTTAAIRTVSVSSNSPRNADGLITDGREKYLADLVFQNVLRNRDSIQSDNFKHDITDAVVSEFERTAVANGRWSGNNLRNEVGEKVAHLITKVNRGDFGEPDADATAAAVHRWNSNRTAIRAAARGQVTTAAKADLAERAETEGLQASMPIPDGAGPLERAKPIVHRGHEQALSHAADGNHESAKAELRKIEPKEEAIRSSLKLSESIRQSSVPTHRNQFRMR